MRVLYSAIPGMGHIYPALGIVRALRDAGHEVTLATSAPIVKEAEPLAPWRGAPIGSTLTERKAESLGRFVGYDWPVSCAKELAALAKSHDLILSGPWDAAAPIASAATDTPRAVLGYAVRPGCLPKLHIGIDHEKLEAGKGHEVANAFGFKSPKSFPCSFVGDEVTTIDLTPPRLHPWPVQYIAKDPHSFLCDLDTSMHPNAEPVDVVITFGSVLLPNEQTVGQLRAFCNARGLSVALLDRDKPINLRGLLAHAKLIVHHGGWGTMMAALLEGVPQLVCPVGEEQLVNGAQIMQRAAGALFDPHVCTLADAFDKALNCSVGASILQRHARGLPPISGAVGVLEQIAEGQKK